MARVGGFGPGVVLDADFFPECGEAEGGLFDEVVRGDALFFCGLLDFLAVLVDACEEEYLIAAEAVVASDDIGEDLFIGVADVGSAVGVIDGGGEVEHGRTGGNQAAGAEARQGMGAREGGDFGGKWRGRHKTVTQRHFWGRVCHITRSGLARANRVR